MAQVTPIVQRIPSLISGLSIDSGMTLKTGGLREDVDTVVLGLDRRKIAKNSRAVLPGLTLSFASE